ncbi:unnamed protein product [Cylindrotheca closterium]|uniref:DUF6824 domain-containing protein n=1 Tax=Cylindrotheca closterium TaxID=2856 RepID=A0AAD2CNU3_9STRA|nr:unnamed protein product [Cylindrotheca closterium]
MTEESWNLLDSIESITPHSDEWTAAANDVANQETGTWTQNYSRGNPRDVVDHLIATTATAPTNIDILFGRGTGNHSHPGNVILRMEVEIYFYHHSSLSKPEKTLFIHEWIKILRSRGIRFLRRDEKGDRWHKVKEDEIKSKLAHCFRTVRKRRNKPAKEPINGTRQASKQVCKQPRSQEMEPSTN